MPKPPAPEQHDLRRMRPTDLIDRRHEITRPQIYGWRRDPKKNGLWSPDRGAVLLPVDFGAPPEPARAPAPPRSAPAGRGCGLAGRRGRRH
jgi:hypothetical protein